MMNELIIYHFHQFKNSTENQLRQANRRLLRNEPSYLMLLVYNVVNSELSSLNISLGLRWTVLAMVLLYLTSVFTNYPLIFDYRSIWSVFFQFHICVYLLFILASCTDSRNKESKVLWKSMKVGFFNLFPECNLLISHVLLKNKCKIIFLKSMDGRGTTLLK